WLMLRYSRKLPFGTFFGISAMLVAVLAVVLAGKGVAALQEAGWLSMSLFDGPRVDLLGIHPTVEGIGLQLAVVAVLVVGFMWNVRQARLARGRAIFRVGAATAASFSRNARRCSGSYKGKRSPL